VFAASLVGPLGGMGLLRSQRLSPANWFTVWETKSCMWTLRLNGYQSPGLVFGR
jgi:hypothetical protein